MTRNLPHHGVKLFVEDRGLVYLAGSVIDYRTD